MRLTAKYSKKQRKAIKDASKARKSINNDVQPVVEEKECINNDVQPVVEEKECINNDVQPFVANVFPPDFSGITHEDSQIAPKRYRKPAPADYDYNKTYFVVPPPQD
jgi:hypothetical protein